MTRFDDGPAKGTTLMLKRAPFLLRVTEQGGNFDALDQVDDEPRPEEKVHVYEASEFPSRVFIDGTRFRGLYAVARYHLCPEQPNDATARDNSEWRAWCDGNAAAVARYEAMRKGEP